MVAFVVGASAQQTEVAEPVVADQSGAAVVSSADELWVRGNTLYAAGDYNGALMAYDSIASQGLESAKLYYNMAGAYFKSSKLGEAILYYNKAAKLRPTDGDIAYNLAYANSFVKDKIDVVPEMLTVRVVRSVGRLLSPSGWGILSLVMLGLTAAAVVALVVSRRRKVRKGFFVVAVIMGAITLVAVAVGGAERRRLLSHDEAVVLWSAAAVKASPDRASKDIFILHEGTKVELKGEYGAWRQVRIADGNEGWIAAEAVGEI